MKDASDAGQSLDGALAGDASARRRLLELVYEDLRAMAGKRMREERASHTLQPTALVHEAFVRLIGQDRGDWRSRGEFLGLAAEAMRRVLIDHARGKNAEKRGGGWRPVPLEEGQIATLDLREEPAGGEGGDLGVHGGGEGLAILGQAVRGLEGPGVAGRAQPALDEQLGKVRSILVLHSSS